MAARSRLNVVEMLALCLGFLGSGYLGKYFEKFIGWWAWLPAVLLGGLLGVVLVGGLVSQLVAWLRRSRGESGPKP